jgi:hypothetical protein
VARNYGKIGDLCDKAQILRVSITALSHVLSSATSDLKHGEEPLLFINFPFHHLVVDIETYGWFRIVNGDNGLAFFEGKVYFVTLGGFVHNFAASPIATQQGGNGIACTPYDHGIQSCNENKGKYIELHGDSPYLSNERLDWLIPGPDDESGSRIADESYRRLVAT